LISVGNVITSASSGAVERVTPVQTRPPLSNGGSGSGVTVAVGEAVGLAFGLPPLAPELEPEPLLSPDDLHEATNAAPTSKPHPRKAKPRITQP
jgi:hypothetical protein